MRDNELAKKVEKAVPAIVSKVAPNKTEDVSEIVRCIANIPLEYLKNKSQIIQAVSKLGGDWIEYSVPIAEKIVDYITIAEESNCRQSEIIINAILSDFDMTIQEKIDIVNKWKENENERKKQIIITVSKYVGGAAAGVAAVVFAPKMAKEAGSLLKTISNNRVKREKIESSERIQMQKIEKKKFILF